MNEQSRVQNLLQRRFQEIKSRNPNFSVRALASKLGMQPSATNEILKGQRRISRQIAEKIVDRLQLDASERAAVLRGFPFKFKSAPVEEGPDAQIRKLHADELALIGEWLHFGILSLIKTKGFKSSAGWMAQRLGVDAADVRTALLRLEHLKLIEIAPNGRISRTAHPIRTSEDVRDLGLQRMHAGDMELARRKLTDVPVDQRDFTNYTFTGNPEQMKRAKEVLRQAQDDLEAIMQDGGEGSEVYRVCMYLFPLTTPQSRENP